MNFVKPSLENNKRAFSFSGLQPITNDIYYFLDRGKRDFLKHDRLAAIYCVHP